MITMEKLLVLKSADLFKKTEDEALLELAMLASQAHFLSGETIFKKGDVGTCMFVIVEGRVKVHDGDNMLAELGPGEVFGEMAALSPEVRIATVTAMEDVTLLKIEREIIYEVMSLNSGLAQGIIEVLCQRARSLARLANK
jgi:CRP/FNR family cyclic AMP-dependent transcriptional regulator